MKKTPVKPVAGKRFGSAKKEKEAVEPDPKPKVPPHQMSSMTWAEEEILRNRVDELSLRAQSLQKKIDELQHMLKMADHKHKTDYDAAVNENVRLSGENTALARDNAALTLKLQRQKEDSDAVLAHTVADREREFMAREQQLLARSKELVHENLGLYEFKEKREKLWTDLAKFQDTLEHNELKYKDDLANCERKWSLISKKTTDDAQALIRDERRRYKLEVRDELDGEFHFTSAENRRLEQELKYHVESTKRLAAENETLHASVKKYKIELALTKDKDEEYAKRGIRQVKQIRELSGKVKTLERSLTQVVMDSELAAKQRALEYRTQIDTLSREAQQHRVAADANHKQHHIVKRHAQTLLQQRTEIERFFLTALEQVKEEIIARREQNYKLAKQQHATYLKSLATGKPLALTGTVGAGATAAAAAAGGGGSAAGSARLPSIRGGSDAGSTLPAGSTAPLKPSDRVDVADLTLEEKDRVLRLLFAKITNHPLAATTAANALALAPDSMAAAASSTLPPHSFDIHLNTHAGGSPAPSAKSAAAARGRLDTKLQSEAKRNSSASAAAAAAAAAAADSASMMLPPPPEMSSQPIALIDGPTAGDGRGASNTFLTDMKVDGGGSGGAGGGNDSSLSASIGMGSRLLSSLSASSSLRSVGVDNPNPPANAGPQTVVIGGSANDFAI